MLMKSGVMRLVVWFLILRGKLSAFHGVCYLFFLYCIELFLLDHFAESVYHKNVESCEMLGSEFQMIIGFYFVAVVDPVNLLCRC